MRQPYVNIEFIPFLAWVSDSVRVYYLYVVIDASTSSTTNNTFQIENYENNIIQLLLQLTGIQEETNNHPGTS